MSHTNVDSNKTYHLTNVINIVEDKKQNKFMTPEGGIDISGKKTKQEHIENPLNSPYIPSQDVAKLKDDNGNIIFEGSLEEVKAKVAELEAKKKVDFGRE